MVKLMRKYIAGIEMVNKAIGNIVMFLLLYMALTLTYEAIARYAFNSPTIWVAEMAQHAMLYIGALGGGYTLMMSGHVKIDVLYGTLKFKARAILDICTSVIFFFFILVLLIESIKMAVNSWTIMERNTSILRPPMYLLKTAIPIGVTLVLLQGIAKLFKDIITIITGEEQYYPSFDDDSSKPKDSDFGISDAVKLSDNEKEVM
jgi:TRAP-type mannitol/chloroaromatic compound transport system permease small subunit